MAGFDVKVVGGAHAPVLPGQDTCANLGYIIQDSLYHPGDSLHVPQQKIDILLVPLQASWLKTSEAVDFIREIAPRRAFGIHDAQVNERALASLNYWFGEHGNTNYEWLAPGTTVDL